MAEILLDVSNKMATSDGLDGALKQVRDICVELVGCERGSIFLHDPSTNELCARIGGRFVREIRVLDTAGIVGDVYTHNRGAIVHDAYADARFDPSADAQTGFKTRSVLCAPLRTKKGTTIGVAQLLNKVEGSFTPDDLLMLEAVIAQSSISLAHLSTIENIEKSRQQELDFLSVVSEISSELQLGPLLQKIMAAITRMLDAERCTLFINDTKTNELYSYVGQGLGATTIRLPNHMGIAGTVFTSNQSVNIPYAYADLRFNPAFDKKTGFFTRSILCVPVTNKAGTVIGVTQVLNKRGGSFNEGDEARLKAFTSQISIGIENAKLFDDVQTIKNYNESILESMSNGVITLSGDGKIVTCNAAGLRILQVGQRDVLDKPAAEFFTGDNAWLVEKINSVRESGVDEVMMDAPLHVAGERLSTNVSVLPLLSGENKTGSMVMIEDISSEISCMGTTYPIERDVPQSRIFVGKPFPNVTLRLLDAQRNPVPFGVVGEICFAGDGVVKGYLDRPELNAEKFVTLEGKRFYCTGDMGRLHTDGQLEFLGRRDFQIQLHGIRIELAGIETVVQQLGLAAQCAVVARPHGEGGMQMVAFVVKPRNERIATFRRALTKELPDYMLPHQVVVLDAMPLTANGKLDRNRLMDMPLPRQTGSDCPTAAPMSERERKVAAIIARTLGMREVGAEDDFFDLGGDSLLGMIALMEIEKTLGVAMPPSLLFEHGTVRSLAAHEGGDIAAVAEGLPRAVLLNNGPEGETPLFMLSGVHIYRPLAKHLEGVCRAYGIFTHREIEAFATEADFQPVGVLADDYIRIMRAQQPHGPYRVLGYSFSGIIAYEVAQRLRAAGEEVSFLALIDSRLPEWNAGWKQRLVMLGRLPRKPWRESTAFLWQKLRQALHLGGGEPIVYHDDHELGEWEVQRGETNYNTIADYRPHIQPSDHPMLLLVSSVRLRGNPLHSPYCGWEPFVAKLDTEYLEADHFQMMRDEPHLSKVAGILRDRLAKSR